MTTTYDQSTVTYDQSSLTYQGLPAQFDGISFAVEMAFGYEPLDDDPSWESVTPYVRGFTINRGRNSEFSTYGPGTVSIALDNRDRRFDPEHTSGPYFGDLNPMVPVRVQATYSGVTYTMFYGFVQGWPTVYNQSNTDAVASVNAIDGTRLLGNVVLESSSFSQRVIDDGAVLYWPMQSFVDVDGWQITYDKIKNVPARASNFPLASVYDAEFPTGDSLAVKSLAGVFHNISGPITSIERPDVLCYSFWFDARVENATNRLIDVVIDRVSGVKQRLLVSIDYTASTTTWAISSLRFDSDVVGLYGSSSSSTTFTPQQTSNMLTFTLDGTNFLVYLNGSVIRTLSLSNSGSVTVSVDEIYITSTYGLPTNTLGISNLVLFDRGLSASEIVDQYNDGLTPAGNVSSQRLDRVLDDAGWPSSWRDIETGVQAVGRYRPSRLSALRYMNQVDNAEQGSLFVNRVGEVEFRSRTTAEAVQVVGLFDDSGTDLPFANVAVDSHTVDAIRNRVDGQYATGVVSAIDSASVVAYSEASESVDLQLVDDPSVAQSIVDARLLRAKDPRTRITRLDVNVRRDPAGIVPVVAALDLSDDVTVSLTPTGVGSALWRAVRVQGISHRVTPQSWDVSLYLAPGPVNTNGPLMILDDAVYGELDANKLG